jgi:mRNA guanylyltransferase
MYSNTSHLCTPKFFPTDPSVEDKSMQFAYGIEMMFRQILPNLAHGNDGLIFTSLEGEYICGTDEHMYPRPPPH